MRRDTTTLILIVLALSVAPLAHAQVPELFVTSDRCLACHNGLVTPTGEDVSIGVGWRPSMMANAARDPYWPVSYTHLRAHETF